MILRPVTRHNAAGDTLITLQSRDNDIAEDTPTRNYDPVQPPASNIQGAFGDGLHRAGVLERDLALCDMTGYTSVFHAKAAIEAALISTTSIRVSGWELPLAAPVGITEWQHLLYGLRVRLRLLPRSPHWRLLTPTVTGEGYQGFSDGRVIDANFLSEAFTAAFVGRVLVFSTGEEALITEFVNTLRVRSDVDQIVGGVSDAVPFTVDQSATGLL